MTENKTNPDIEVLEAVKTAAREKMVDNPIEANINAFLAAERAIDALKEKESGPAERIFKDRMEVLGYLQRRNYCTNKGLIKKSKIYHDSRPGGILKVDPKTKEITLSAVKKYIAKAELMQPTVDGDAAGGADPRGAGAPSEKQSVELDRLREQMLSLREKRLRESGQFIKKDDHYLELASRAAIFNAFLRHKILMFSSDLVRAIEDQAHHADKVKALESGLLEVIGEGLAEYTDINNYQVMFDFEDEMLIGKEDIEQGDDETANM